MRLWSGDYMPDTNVTQKDEDAPGWAVRLEAKIDVALAQHSSRLDNHDQQIAETKQAVNDSVTREEFQDHETRMRTQESRKTVTPGGLMGAVIATATAVGSLSPLLEALYT